MTPGFSPGDTVQTPLGKGVVLEVRNQKQLLVVIQGRSVVVDAALVTAIQIDTRRRSRAAEVKILEARATPARSTKDDREQTRSLDLHGLTVEEALARVEQAVNESLLADDASLRLIHGQSGGRIRHALHRWLSRTPSVRGFRIDPQNAGVTIVTF